MPSARFALGRAQTCLRRPRIGICLPSVRLLFVSLRARLRSVAVAQPSNSGREMSEQG